MEVIKSFTNNNRNITILGTHDAPLFRASEIGDVLEMYNIRATIQDFNDTEKVVKEIDTPGGKQKVTFLTESGLYYLLCRSNKPIAKEFRIWVFEVLKEIRLNGSYTLNKTIEDQKKTIEEQKNTILTIKAENEIYSNCKEGTPVIYVYNTDTREETKNPPIKIGVTEKLRERVKPYKQTHPWGKIVFYAEINNNHISLKAIEHWIHTLLNKYLIKGEVFSIDWEEAKYHILSVVNIIKLTNHDNKEERKLKFAKLIDNQAMIIDNLSNPNISKRDISIQTDDINTNNNDDVIESNTSQNEKHNKFDKYIQECCDKGENFEVATKEIVGQYRIWAKCSDQETYHALLDYLKVKFRPVRLKVQDKDYVINGFRGVKLKQIEYKQSIFSEPEIFTFNVCAFSPSAKILRCDIVKNYIDWRRRNNKNIDQEKDGKAISDYLKKNEYIFQAALWTPSGNGIGYYGLNIKSIESSDKKTSSTAKKVQKRDITTHEILDSWTTIAKAAIAEGISAAKMSRSIKNNNKYETYYYCIET